MKAQTGDTPHVERLSVRAASPDASLSALARTAQNKLPATVYRLSRKLKSPISDRIGTLQKANFDVCARSDSA
jgi:hypothetical protein